MLSSQTLAKGDRQTNIESSDTSPLTNSSEYWFFDGSIILQAEDTLFRVHLSVLTRHSEIFMDMSSLPQPTEDGQKNDEVIEGCPVIKLSDNAKDIEVLLSLLYDAGRVNNFRKPIPMQVLSAMLRLGRKYQINHLEQEAIERLQVDFPTSLDAWDALFQPSTTTESQCPAQGRSFKLIDLEDHGQTDSYYDPILTEVINLAHEYNIKTILPAAYASYLYRYSIQDLVSNSDHVPPKAKDRCLIGRASIVNFVNTEHIKSLQVQVPDTMITLCKSCRKKKFQVINNLPIWKVERRLVILAPVSVEDEIPDENSSSVSEVKESLSCRECGVSLELFARKVRGELWEKLPNFFDLT